MGNDGQGPRRADARSWRARHVGVAVVAWLVLASAFAVLVPASPASAIEEGRPVGCDADGDGRADGDIGQWRSTGADDTARLLGATTGLELAPAAAGELYEVPVCVETGDASGAGAAVAVTGRARLASAASLTRLFEAAALAQALRDLERRSWRPAPRIAPDHTIMQVVELETWLAIDPEAWETITSTKTVGWVTVTATATPIFSVYEFTDETFRCPGPGVQYVPGAPGPAPCGRDWDTTTSVAPMSMEVYIEYAVTFQSSAGLVGGFPRDGDSLGVYDLEVGEIQSIGALGTSPHPPDPGLLPDPPAISLPDCTLVALAEGGCPPPEPADSSQGGGSKCGFSFTGVLSCIDDATDWVIDTAVDGGEWIVDAAADGAEWITEQFVEFYKLLPGPLKAIVDALAGCIEFGLDVVSGIWDIAKQLIAAGQDPIGFVQEQLEAFNAIKDAIAADPLAFAEEFLGDLAELDLLEENPAKWVGKIGCEIAAAIFTGGAAAGTGRIARLLNKIDDIKIWGRNRRNGGDNDGPGNDRPDNDRPPRDRGPECALNSFPAGTTVLMGDGTRVPIEQIEPGDSVLAADPKTGDWTARAVTDQWSHLDVGVMATAVLADGSEVSATDDHLFWVASTGAWSQLEHVASGDYLLTPDGAVMVSAVELSRPTETEVWELDVAVDDTFAVGTGTADVLVHNGCKNGGRNSDLVRNAPSPTTRPGPPRQVLRRGGDPDNPADWSTVRNSGNMIGPDADGRYWVETRRADGSTHRTEFSEDGFPVYESEFDLKLDDSDLIGTRAQHNRAANDRLARALDEGDAGLSPDQANAVRDWLDNGDLNKAPDGYTWHHHENTGVMQLVPEGDHIGNHTGGHSIWGVEPGGG